MAIETERKFLIRLPDPALLRSQPECRVRQIHQTYLKKLPGKNLERRLRRIEENGKVSWIFTRKVKLSKLSRREDEWELTEREYGEWYGEADTELTKTRYSFPYEGHVMEIDVYPFEIGGEGLAGRAVLEVELGSEDEPFAVPEFIEIERELTGTREFSNKAMAKKVR